MSPAGSTFQVACSSIAEQVAGWPSKRRGRPSQPDEELVAAIKTVIGSLPMYGSRRVHAHLVGQVQEQGRAPLNHKRVYQVMKAYGLLLQPYAGGVEQR